MRKLLLGLAILALFAALGGFAIGNAELGRVAAVAGVVALALGIPAIVALQGYQYTLWIVAAVVAAMLFPSAFLRWGDFDLRNKWLILVVVQLVMFGMGTQMSLGDFHGIVRTPRGVIVGILCHFSVMPLVGYALTKVFHFEPEIAAGVILIGSCSSGLASNVMAYIAKSNLVLSVTVTAITTLVAPFMTPLLMKLFANTWVEVKFISMMTEIIKIVIVPIGAALLHDYLKNASARGRLAVHGLAIFAAVWLAFLALGGWNWIVGHSFGDGVLRTIALFGFFMAAILAGVSYHALATRNPMVDTYVPLLSMMGIVYFTAVTTAAGRENLLKIGLLLFLAAAIHNAAGYFFGYWLSRAFGLDKNSARSVAFEVGLQNGAMASGVAGGMGKLATVGLAAAIFSPWMNISGSILANHWRRKPVPSADQLSRAR